MFYLYWSVLNFSSMYLRMRWFPLFCSFVCSNICSTLPKLWLVDFLCFRLGDFTCTLLKHHTVVSPTFMYACLQTFAWVALESSCENRLTCSEPTPLPMHFKKKKCLWRVICKVSLPVPDNIWTAGYKCNKWLLCHNGFSDYKCPTSTKSNSQVWKRSFSPCPSPPLKSQLEIARSAKWSN